MINILALLLAALFGLSSGVATSSPDRAYGSGSAPSVTAAAVVLEVGHCWIEPVTSEGVEWGVPLDHQVGWGGGLPRRWVGAGEIIVRSSTRATYVDAGGATLPLRPAHSPSVSLAGLACD